VTLLADSGVRGGARVLRRPRRRRRGDRVRVWFAEPV